MSQTVMDQTQYWDLVPAIVGGIIGALAGGIPAWLIAKRQSDESLRRDEDQHIKKQKALAFSVCVKLLEIINSTVVLANHVKSSFALLQDASHSHMEPWQILIPMIGFSDEKLIRFTPEEMAVFGSSGKNEFMMDVMLLANRHAATIAAFEEYCRMRLEFRSIAPVPISFDGQIGSSEITAEQYNKLKPYTIPLNSVALGLDQGLSEDLELARSVAENFGPVTKEIFKTDKFAELSFPSDAELAEMQKAPPTA